MREEKRRDSTRSLCAEKEGFVLVVHMPCRVPVSSFPPNRIPAPTCLLLHQFNHTNHQHNSRIFLNLPRLTDPPHQENASLPLPAHPPPVGVRL